MMASPEVFVGIDVSKDRLDVHVRPLGIGFAVSNEAAGHAALIARLRALRTKRIVLEATGGYERALWLALSEAGLVAAVVNPRQVRRVCPRRRTAGQDRPARRRGDRPFRRDVWTQH
jgi:transposase